MNRKLKLAMFLLLGTFMSAVLISSGYGGEQGGKLPIMYIYETDVDLGEVYEGVDIKHTFTVRNDGQDNLDIKVEPG
jgi:hypothetical protein